jgi:uncharacterized membrane protein required for colicin V production
VIDFTALMVILLDAYFGFRRGLSGETARFFVLILGIVTTVLLLHPVGTLCFRYASPVIPEPARYSFAFVATTITAAVIMLLAYRPIYNWLDLNAPKHRNKFGGLVAGLMRGFIGVTVVLIVLNLWPSPEVNRIVGDASIAGRTANKIVPIVKSRLSSHGWAATEPNDRSKGRSKGVLDVFREEKRDRDSVTK